ncbi:MAG: hypothetical protein J6A59_13375 [Lachnospiraceae bacterium]|nr:hypothetical protein [Lachnospiraceae bacterium]MBR3833904.1 hypothetical protein [Lachnospiraceae bacterium]
MSSIITVLKKVYKEGLEPKGFVQLKGRHPYFVRVIGGEIVQVITFRKESGPTILFSGNNGQYRPDLEQFDILGGIATVYRNKIDLSISPSHNINWLSNNSEIYYRTTIEGYDKEYKNSLNCFSYIKNDEESMQEAAKRSLEATLNVMIPVFDKVTDLPECVKYLEKCKASCIYLCDEKKYGWTDDRFGGDEYNEGLLYIKTRNNDDFFKQCEYACKAEYERRVNRKAGFNKEEYDRYCVSVEENRLEKIRIRDRILNTPEIYLNAMNELERRKIGNVEVLRSYGLEL